MSITAVTTAPLFVDRTQALWHINAHHIPRLASMPQIQNSPQVIKCLCWAVTGLFLLVLAAAGHISYANWFQLPSDALAYWDGGLQVQAGQPIYEDLDPRNIGRPYIYPPFLAACFSVLTRLGPSIGLAVWSAVHTLVLILLLRECALFAKAHRVRHWWLYPPILLIVLFTPLWQEYSVGQVNLLVTLIFLFGLLQVHRDKPVSGGVLLAVAAHIKVLPVAVILFLLVQRKFKAAGVMSAAMAALLLFVWPFAVPKLGLIGGLAYSIEQNYVWVTDIFINALGSQQVAGSAFLTPANVSFRAVLTRLISTDSAGYAESSLPIASLISALLTGAIVVGSLWAARKDIALRLGRVTWPFFAYVGLQLGNMLCWGHHMISLIVPASALLIASRSTRARLLAAVAFLPYVVSLTLPNLIMLSPDEPTREFGQERLAEGLHLGMPVWGALLILMVSAVALRDQGTKHEQKAVA